MSFGIQGSYIYTLYRYTYNLPEGQVAFLFSVGFLAAGPGAAFGGFLADKFGRRLLCLAYCWLYALSCVATVSGNFSALVCGRILGGISSSLLYTVFEAWLLGELQRVRLASAETRVGSLFGAMSTCNGMVAILSGILSQLLVYVTGSVKAPFLASVLCLVIAAGLIRRAWVSLPPLTCLMLTIY